MYGVFEQYLDRVIGDGECVALVKLACGCPQTTLWKRGDPVKDSTLLPGTAIATFDPPSEQFPEGHYGNHTDGRSHAAIFLSQEGPAIRVIDQWRGQPVHERLIFWRPGKAANDASQFYVIA